MATDFGYDLSCKDDLDPAMIEARGPDLVREAAHRRLTTPRGQLLGDLDYGLDLRGFLSAEVTPTELAQIPGQIDAELTKDERIEASSTTAAWDPANRSLTITVAAKTGAGPFSLVLPISQAATTITKTVLGGG